MRLIKMNNILSRFLNSVREGGDNCCFLSKNGDWKKYSWEDVGQKVGSLAGGLLFLGVKEGSRVAILSQTRMEWTIIDLAVLACRAVTVPIYPTYPPERIRFILKDADVSLVFVEDAKGLEKLSEAVLGLPNPPVIIGIENEVKGTPLSLADLNSKADEIRDDDVATIIYTSGTTGDPKGVVLTHGNIAAEVEATSQIFRFKKDDIGLLCLPLSHVLGRLMQFHHLAGGYRLAFLEEYQKFADNCCEIKPHFVVGVPRMVEKMHEKMSSILACEPAWKRSLFSWAVGVGRTRSRCIENKTKISAILSLKYTLAALLVFRQLMAKLGGRLNLFICGGAPLADGLGEFFNAIGFLILEGYGLTETFAAATVNHLNDFRFGTVGKAVPGVELKIADDGEILIKGKTVFREYLNLPQETKCVKTEGGWFRTGDIGRISKDGFLQITDRKKEIIVSAGGHNIAPQVIENLLMEDPHIDTCMVYGDRKKYLTALITLNQEKIKSYAKKIGILGPHDKLVTHPKIKEYIASLIEEKNKRLARHETIKKFTILPVDFSEAGGELTPTLKLKRKFIAEKYKDLLEAMYRV